jgi:hypothetical protein
VFLKRGKVKIYHSTKVKIYHSTKYFLNGIILSKKIKINVVIVFFFKSINTINKIGRFPDFEVAELYNTIWLA